VFNAILQISAEDDVASGGGHPYAVGKLASAFDQISLESTKNKYVYALLQNGNRLLKSFVMENNLQDKNISLSGTKYQNFIFHNWDSFGPPAIDGNSEIVKEYILRGSLYTFTEVDYQHLIYPANFSDEELKRRQSAEIFNEKYAVAKVAISSYTFNNSPINKPGVVIHHGVDVGYADFKLMFSSLDFRIFRSKNIIINPSKNHKHKQLKRSLNDLSIVQDWARMSNIMYVITNVNYFEIVEFNNLALVLGIQDLVYFTGPLEEDLISDLFSISQSILSYSYYEGFGMTLLEASYFNKNFFGYEIPAYLEQIKSYRLSKCFLYKDYVNLFAEVLKHQNFIKSIDQINFKSFDEFSWRKKAQQYIDFFYELIRKNNEN